MYQLNKCILIVTFCFISITLYLQETVGSSNRDTEVMEKGQKETAGTDKKDRQMSDSDKSDNEDSEPDDYNLTEDQRRALEELDNLKSELGYPGQCFSISFVLISLYRECYQGESANSFICIVKS